MVHNVLLAIQVKVDGDGLEVSETPEQLFPINAQTNTEEVRAKTGRSGCSGQHLAFKFINFVWFDGPTEPFIFCNGTFLETLQDRREEVAARLFALLESDVTRGRSTEGVASKNDIENIKLWKSGQ